MNIEMEKRRLHFWVSLSRKMIENEDLGCIALTLIALLRTDLIPGQNEPSGVSGKSMCDV